MKAAVVQQFGRPLVIEDRPIPEPGPGQISVRMEASGLCHTDIHAAHGDWPVKPIPPFVPGHEGVGIVHAVGNGVIYEDRHLSEVNEAIDEVLQGRPRLVWCCARRPQNP